MSAGRVGGPLLLAVDQGTSATKALLVDARDGVDARSEVVARASVPLGCDHPRPGWVEQSADAIWDSVRDAVRRVLDGHDPAHVAGLALSTQRESCLLWERSSGRPLGPVIGWQDRRTTPLLDRVAAEPGAGRVRGVTGLPLDPMFSALKARWLLDTHDPDRVRARRGELCLGTVDSWLLWCLGGVHVTEAGNAARTQLCDIRTRQWDAELLALFGVPREALPLVLSSVGPFPAVRDLPPLREGTPVAAVLGDSHAALLGHGVSAPGSVKVTYGTGSSVMGLVPGPVPLGDSPLCLTPAWDDGSQAAYALEGNIRSSGATVRWLAGLLGTGEGELSSLAAADSDGVHIVPAFGGLAAPWWDPGATGVVSGLTLGSGAAQMARAALESVAFQVEDVVAGIDRAAGTVTTLLADGGPSGDDLLMRIQADVSGRLVRRPQVRDASALGAARLAGRALGLYTARSLPLPPAYDDFRPDPALPDDERARRVEDWHAAVARALSARKLGARPAPGTRPGQ
ncbi:MULTISPECIES: FGGY family carbohydrate kinase [unclassified Streptomyces]|uniref:FGGY family carbohydrate kinase n=1 Tax=unclassified Streptomyces TaxID=2593676 RepID=UPI00380B9177